MAVVGLAAGRTTVHPSTATGICIPIIRITVATGIGTTKQSARISGAWALAVEFGTHRAHTEGSLHPCEGEALPTPVGLRMLALALTRLAQSEALTLLNGRATE